MHGDVLHHRELIVSGTIDRAIFHLGAPAALAALLLAAFAGAQWTTIPAVVVIGLTAARVPVAAWLVAAGWGVEGVWFAIASTTVIKGITLAAMFAWRLR